MATSTNAVTVIAEALELPPSFALQADTPIASVPGWDSYGWIAVISALEDTFAIEFPIDDVDTMKTLGDLIATVERAIERRSSLQ